MLIRIRLLVIASVLFAGYAIADEPLVLAQAEAPAASDESSANEDEARAATEAAEDEAEDDPSESGNYEDDEDFIPSKEVSADQPLDYPVDIL